MADHVARLNLYLDKDPNAISSTAWQQFHTIWTPKLANSWRACAVLSVADKGVFKLNAFLKDNGKSALLDAIKRLDPAATAVKPDLIDAGYWRIGGHGLHEGRFTVRYAAGQTDKTLEVDGPVPVKLSIVLATTTEI